MDWLIYRKGDSMDNAYHYSLRYTIAPGFHEEERLDALLQFCQNADIDDVMLFLNAGELNRGHLTVEVSLPWLALARRVKERLAERHMTLSLNPWVTLLHGDCGRALSPGLSFQRMVDPFGREAECVACPLDASFQSNLTEVFQAYASVRPYAIWIEDDFRLHNHQPLSWGGCFCPLHMERYSALAGRKLTREEFVRGLLSPGAPHPYRKIWLDVSRDTLVGLARKIGEAIHRVSPGCRVGLMSSAPYVHCAEGRDWEALLEGLAGDTPLLNRPNLPSYVENTSQQYLCDFNSISHLSRAFVPEHTLIEPELEDYPFTRFAKSRAFVQFQVELASTLCPAGMTISLHDVMGNGELEGENFDLALGEIKPFLSRLKALDLSPKDQKGIRILADPASSSTLHTPQGRSMEELYPNEHPWSSLFSAYSIAHGFCTDPAQAGEVVAVSGQYFRNLPDETIRTLFENNFVILDGAAVSILFERGLGELLGIKELRFERQDSGKQAYEQVLHRTCCGIAEARLSAQASVGNYVNITYHGEITVESVLKSPAGEPVGPGMAVGAHFCILPYELRTDTIQGHLNPIRQKLLFQILQEQTAAACPSYAENGPYIGVYDYERDGRRILLVANASRDDVKSLRINVSFPFDNAAVMTRGEPEPSRIAARREGNTLLLETGLKSLEVKALLQL